MIKILVGIGVMSVTLTYCYADKVKTSTHSMSRFDGSDIQYHVKRNDSLDKQPLALFLQGSDCNSIKNNAGLPGYLEMAPGYAVLLVEKYGITDELPSNNDDSRTDCPKEYLKNNTLSQRVLDAMQVIAHMRRTAKWWDGDLLLVGGSSGAMVASQVAAIAPETTQLIIFGFGSRYFKQDLMFSIRASLKSEGLPDAVAREQMRKIEEHFDNMSANPSSLEYSSGHSFAYWSAMLSFDQHESLAQVSAPILAVQGMRDESVSPHGANDLIKALKKRSGTLLDYFQYPDLDHGFKNADGVSEKQRVVKDMAQWIE